MQYDKNPPLLEADLLPDPLAQFALWLQDASAAGQIEPTAMTLATVGSDGRPSARVVLFKGIHEGQLSFYTNHEGRKGREIESRPDVAATFWWDRLERQVRIEGRAQRLPREVSQRYFESRPRGSQIGALTSRQSSVVASREELDIRMAGNEARLQGQPVPLPEFWGGYGIRPDSVEFWQGRRGRLHDRLRYVWMDQVWRIERLEP
ncbi:MAG: pyridoxamine 5'-phosphate oxidase [Panacagrimonas sp.]